MDDIKEAVALLCNDCLNLSRYKMEYNDRLPKGWCETDKGYFCNACKKEEVKSVRHK